MSEPSRATYPAPTSPWAAVLRGVGLVYLGLGALLVAGFAAGVDSSLFPTGWLFPAVLVASGGLMAARRRFDVAVTLWGGLFLATLLLGAMLYVDALDLGLDDPSAFDATVIVAGFGLLVLLLRPGFRD